MSDGEPIVGGSYPHGDWHMHIHPQPVEQLSFMVRLVGRCSPTSQSHIIPDTYDPKHTLCGVKISSRPSTAGITRADFVQRHIDGHNPEWCERCLYEWSKP